MARERPIKHVDENLRAVLKNADDKMINTLRSSNKRTAEIEVIIDYRTVVGE